MSNFESNIKTFIISAIASLFLCASIFTLYKIVQNRAVEEQNVEEDRSEHEPKKEDLENKDDPCFERCEAKDLIKESIFRFETLQSGVITIIGEDEWGEKNKTEQEIETDKRYWFKTYQTTSAGELVLDNELIVYDGYRYEKDYSYLTTASMGEEEIKKLDKWFVQPDAWNQNPFEGQYLMRVKFMLNAETTFKKSVEMDIEDGGISADGLYRNITVTITHFPTPIQEHTSIETFDVVIGKDLLPETVTNKRYNLFEGKTYNNQISLIQYSKLNENVIIPLPQD